MSRPAATPSRDQPWRERRVGRRPAQRPASASSAATGLRTRGRGPPADRIRPLMPRAASVARAARALAPRPREKSSSPSRYGSRPARRRRPDVAERDQRVPAKPRGSLRGTNSRSSGSRSGSSSRASSQAARSTDGAASAGSASLARRSRRRGSTGTRPDRCRTRRPGRRARPSRRPASARRSASSTRGTGSRRAPPARRVRRSGRRRCSAVHDPHPGRSCCGRLDLDLGHERAEDDPGAVPRVITIVFFP